MRDFTILATALLLCIGCSKKVITPYNYLALGDSYTIGESVTETMRWPVQLVGQLKEHGMLVNAPTIIATTGWTTEELIQGIEKAELSETYDLVSLLIGVNDQYRGYPFENYKPNFETLLETAIELAGGIANRVFVLSIPDYGVTPFGQSSNPKKIARELDNYNNVAKAICQNYNVDFYNITELSRLALDDKSLIAVDKLHPSASMYTIWADLIRDDVKSKLK